VPLFSLFKPFCGIPIFAGKNQNATYRKQSHKKKLLQALFQRLQQF